MSEIGREIRRLREARGWTQVQLAMRAGASNATVNRIETGERNPSTDTLVRLAGALGIEIADLFPKVEQPLPFDNPPVNAAGWAAAVQRAHGIREGGSQRLAQQLEAWRTNEDATLRRAHLDGIAGMLDEARNAERGLWAAGATGSTTDEYINELQEASRFYGELCGMTKSAGLYVYRTNVGDRVDEAPAA